MENIGKKVCREKKKKGNGNYHGIPLHQKRKCDLVDRLPWTGERHGEDIQRIK